MFFENMREIPEIAKRTGCSVFVVPENVPVVIKNAIILEPEDKTVISIEQARNVMAKLKLRQTGDMFILIRPAEKLGLDAANAMLKSFEEPGDKVHFVLVTSSPSLLLPTVLSRSAIYVLKTTPEILKGVEADEKTKALAKKMIGAKGAELVKVAEEITKKKEGVRAYALSIIGTAVELLYKSYFINKDPTYLARLSKFLTLYENVEKNGHIKLHIVADLA